MANTIETHDRLLLEFWQLQRPSEVLPPLILHLLEEFW